MESSSKSGTQRRIRRSREEWRALVARFEESGQTRARFCAELGVAVSTLTRWRGKLRQPAASARATQTPVFVELPGEEKSPRALVRPWEVELHIPESIPANVAEMFLMPAANIAIALIGGGLMYLIAGNLL